MLTLWKSLVQCKLDYCSQLWNPSDKGDIQALEMVQRSFLRKLPGMSQLTYWQQLKHLHMYSQERRRERYIMIYIWRILEGQVPNITRADGVTGKVNSRWHIRRGRECLVPRVKRTAPFRIQRLCYASLPVKGQQLFNTLPAVIRNTTGCSTDSFKRILDKYLVGVPDEPQIPGYTSFRRAQTNSLLDMAQFGPAHYSSRVDAPVAHSNTGNEGVATSVAVGH